MASLDNFSVDNTQPDFLELEKDFSQTLRNMIEFSTGFSKAVTSFSNSVKSAVDSLNDTVKQYKKMDFGKPETLSSDKVLSQFKKMQDDFIKEKKARLTIIENEELKHKERLEKISKSNWEKIKKGNFKSLKDAFDTFKANNKRREALEKGYQQKKAKALKKEKKIEDDFAKSSRKFYKEHQKEFEELGISMEDFSKKFGENMEKNKSSILDYLNALNINKVASYFSSLSESALDTSKKIIKASSKTYSEISKNRARYHLDLASYAEIGEMQYTIMSEMDMSSLEDSASLAAETLTGKIINGLEASDLSSVTSDIISSGFDVKTLQRINLEIYNLSDNLNVSKTLLAETVNTMTDSTLAFTQGNVDLYNEMNSEILSSTAAMADAVSADFAKVMTSGISSFLESTKSGVDYFKNISAEQQMFLTRGGSSAMEAYTMAQSGDYEGLLDTYIKALENIDPNSAFGRMYGYNMLESMGIGGVYADWRSGNISKADLTRSVAEAMDKTYGSDLASALSNSSSANGFFEKIGNTISNVFGPAVERLQSTFGLNASDVSQAVILGKMLIEVTTIRKHQTGEEIKKIFGKNGTISKAFSENGKIGKLLKPLKDKTAGSFTEMNAVAASKFWGPLMKGLGITAFVGTAISALNSLEKAAVAKTEEERKAYSTGAAIKGGGLALGAAGGLGAVALGASGPVGWIIGGVIALLGLIIGSITEDSMLKAADTYSTDAAKRLNQMKAQNEDSITAMTLMYNNALRLQFENTGKNFEELLDETISRYNDLTETGTDNAVAMANRAINSMNTAFTGAANKSAQAALSEEEFSARASTYRALLASHSHANGLDYVPYDDYPALLHKGETVLTSEQAGFYRSGVSAMGISGFQAAMAAAKSGVLPNGQSINDFVSSMTQNVATTAVGTTLATIKDLSLNISNSLLDLAREVIYDAETSNRDIGSVVANDNGGLSIGLGQWHNSRAFGLLRSLRSLDEAAFSKILEKYPNATIGKDIDTKSGSGYVPTTTNINAIRAILEHFGDAPQNQLMAYDIQGYMSKAKSKGFKDVMSLIIASTIMHNIGNLDKFPTGEYTEDNILNAVQRYSTKYDRAKTAFDALKTGKYSSLYAGLVSKYNDPSSVEDAISSNQFASSAAKAAVMWATENLGAPYEGNGRPGSRSRSILKGDAYNAFDCSSLVYRAYNAMGENPYMTGSPLGSLGSTATIYNTASSHGFTKLWDKNINNGGVYGNASDIMALGPQPGDIILYGNGQAGRPLGINHVALVKDASTQIHANGTVREDRLHPYNSNHLAAYFRQGASSGVVSPTLTLAKAVPVQAAYATGTPWVPDDQVAIIHKNEAIIPPDLNPYNNGVSVPFGESSYDNSEVVEAIRQMKDALLAMMQASDQRADRRQQKASTPSAVDSAAKLLGLR